MLTLVAVSHWGQEPWRLNGNIHGEQSVGIGDLVLESSSTDKWTFRAVFGELWSEKYEESPEGGRERGGGGISNPPESTAKVYCALTVCVCVLGRGA